MTRHNRKYVISRRLHHHHHRWFVFFCSFALSFIPRVGPTRRRRSQESSSTTAPFSGKQSSITYIYILGYIRGGMRERGRVRRSWESIEIGWWARDENATTPSGGRRRRPEQNRSRASSSSAVCSGASCRHVLGGGCSSGSGGWRME